MRKLSELVNVLPGYPFRGKIDHDPDGEARAVQMKDVSESGGVAWDELVRTELKGRRKPDWLQSGDVLFLVRGNKNFAVHLDEVPFPAVISPHFLLLKVRRNAKLLPAFLAWQINQAPAQRYLDASAEGTVQRSIRKGVLEDLPLVAPELEAQQVVMNYAQAARSETEAYMELIANRERELKAVASMILTPDTGARSELE
ncbi:MAG: restriction endonuclease subunit S [Desulfomicrobium sp.]